MNEDLDLPDEERGLYPKYRAFKLDNEVFEQYGSEKIETASIVVGGILMNEVTDPFLLLKFKDPDASAALLAYANAVEDRYPKLAADIREKLLEVNLEELRSNLVGSQGDTIPLGIVSVEQLATAEGRLGVANGIVEQMEAAGIPIDRSEDEDDD